VPLHCDDSHDNNEYRDNHHSLLVDTVALTCWEKRVFVRRAICPQSYLPTGFWWPLHWIPRTD